MNGPYKIGTLARLTGIAPVLLRAWERRFGLLEPLRGPGGQRLYTDEDLAVLRHVKSLVDGGRAIGEVARVGRENLLAGARAAVQPAGADVPGADVWRERLVNAALALDARAFSATLDDLFVVFAADRAVHDVIEPVTKEIGDLWAAGSCSISSEHLASAQFRHRLARLLDNAQPPDHLAPRVVAACLPGEQHELGLLITAWHLARHGVRVTYLGAGLPLDDLAQSVLASSPAAVLLSVTRAALFAQHRRDITRMAAKGSVGRVFVGGQGVPAKARADRSHVELIGGQSAVDVVSRLANAIRAAGEARPVRA